MRISRLTSRLFGRGSPSTSGETANEAELRYFLSWYDARSEETVRREEFDREDEAAAAYAKAERAYAGEDIQVLMFTGDSWGSLETTHPHYFTREDERTPLVGA